MRKVLKDLEVTWIPVFLSLIWPPSRVQRVTSGMRSSGDKTPSLIILCFTFFMNPWMIDYDLWLPEQEGPRTVGPQGTTSAQSSALRPSQLDNHVSSRGLLASSVLPRCHLSCPLFPLPQPGFLRKLFFSNSLPQHLLKEASTNPHDRFLLYQLQQLLLGQGALFQVHIGGK